MSYRVVYIKTFRLITKRFTHLNVRLSVIRENYEWRRDAITQNKGKNFILFTSRFFDRLRVSVVQVSG